MSRSQLAPDTHSWEHYFANLKDVAKVRIVPRLQNLATVVVFFSTTLTRPSKNDLERFIPRHNCGAYSVIPTKNESSPARHTDLLERNCVQLDLRLIDPWLFPILVGTSFSMLCTNNASTPAFASAPYQFFDAQARENFGSRPEIMGLDILAVLLLISTEPSGERLIAGRDCCF